MPEITQILKAIGQGDAHAADELLPVVYQELRCLAEEASRQTLQPSCGYMKPASLGLAL